jgi:hypothetical protein
MMSAGLRAAGLARIAGLGSVLAARARVAEIWDAVSGIFLKPAAGVLMMHGAGPGVLLWLVLATEPRLAVAGVLGSLLGEALRRLMAVNDTSGLEGCIKANALLAAVAASWLTRAAGIGSFAEALIICGVAAMAAVVAAAIRRALEGTALPSLVWAYCIVAALLFELFPEWAIRSALMTVWGPPPSTLVDWLLTLLRALGSFMFSSTPWAGALIAVALLLWSRALFLCGLIGWVAGVAVARFLVYLGEIYYWIPTSYNFFIAGMVLGAVRFLPSRAGIGIAAAAGAFASVAAAGLQYLFYGSSAT